MVEWLLYVLYLFMYINYFFYKKKYSNYLKLFVTSTYLNHPENEKLMCELLNKIYIYLLNEQKRIWWKKYWKFGGGIVIFLKWKSTEKI